MSSPGKVIRAADVVELPPKEDGRFLMLNAIKRDREIASNNALVCNELLYTWLLDYRWLH